MGRGVGVRGKDGERKKTEEGNEVGRAGDREEGRKKRKWEKRRKKVCG
jgi:hypothetical protein